MVAGHLDTKAHAQHFGLTRRQAVQNIFDHIAQTGLHGRFHGRCICTVFDEIAQMAVVIIADRRFHGNRLFGDLHDLADLVFGNFHTLSQNGCIRFEAELLQMLATDPVHLVDGLDHVDRDADSARLVGNRARDRLADPPSGVRRELIAAAIFELVHCLHQTDIAFLNQIQELQATIGVFLGNRDHQAQIGLDHFALGRAAGGLALVHALVDVF